MTIISNIDLGTHPTWNASMSTRKGAVWGAETQTAIIEGGQSTIWERSGIVRKRTETIWISVTPPDPKRVMRLKRQLQELSNNPNMKPVYIQWASGGGNIVADPEDGWYTLENVTPDEEVNADGILPVQVTVSYLTPGLGSEALAISYIGGPASIGWGGPTQDWLAYPLNATGVPFLVNRFGADGYIPISYQLPAGAITPQLFIPSSTVSDNYKDRVAVYDTLNTSQNPVPVAGGAVNANWVEVFHPDHLFEGDCVITNGLYLLLCQVGQRGVSVYFWNIVTSQWLAFGTLDGFDNNNSLSIFQILRGIKLSRISYQESSIVLFLATSAKNWVKWVVRVVAGGHFARCQLVESSQTNNILQVLQLTPNTAPKVSYNDTQVRDNTLTLEQGALPLTSTGFGYSAAFANSSGFPCIYGWLYLDNTGQTQQGFAGAAGLGVGDSILLPAINQSRFYGLFIAPFPAPQNLQAEGESGFFGAGWSTNANTNASGGSEAMAASGTASGSRDIFGTQNYFPPPGAYDVWFHMRVTSNAGTTPEMTVGLWDDDGGGGAGAYVPGGSTTFAANQIPTTYTGTGSNWKKANITTPLVPTSGHRMRFRAVVAAATLGTDWFIDEAILVPVKMLPSFNSLDGPQEIWSNFAFDRATKVIVAQ